MLYQTHTARNSAAASVHFRHTRLRRNGSLCCFAAYGVRRTPYNGDDAAVFPFLSLVTLTFDLDISTRPSQGPNTSSL